MWLILHQKVSQNQKAGDPGLFLYNFFTPLSPAFTPPIPPAFHTAAIPLPSCTGGFMDFLYLFLFGFFTLLVIGLIHGLDSLGEAS